MSVVSRITLVLFALTSATLSACSWQTPVASPPTAPPQRSPAPVVTPTPNESARSTAVAVALAQVGKPYRFGGASPNEGFDCSGLVWFAYRNAGVQTPRTTRAMWRELVPIGRDELLPGDLLFFNIDGKPEHVGLYIGDDRFVHAPSSGKTVTVADMSQPYYRRVWLRGARVTD
ncbi:MAG: C40 family peptidase [Pseudomonadota bacterium]